MCLWRVCFNENLCWQTSHSWTLSLRWIAVMCRLSVTFRENCFWQNSHSWGFSLRWIAVMCWLRLSFRENISWQNSHSWGFYLRWIAMMCFWRWVFPWKSFLTKFTLVRLFFEVDYCDVLIEIVLPWKSFLTKFTLMKLFFEVDCHDALFEISFLWLFFDKIHTHEASLWGGPLSFQCFGYHFRLCTLCTAFLWGGLIEADVLFEISFLRFFWQNLHSWGFSLRWIAVLSMLWLSFLTLHSVYCSVCGEHRSAGEPYTV